jgi:hypothetical protein
MLPDLAGPAGTEIYMKEALEQVVELFHAPASVGCSAGAAKMPVLRQRHDAIALEFFLKVPWWQLRRRNSIQPRSTPALASGDALSDAVSCRQRPPWSRCYRPSRISPVSENNAP